MAEGFIVRRRARISDISVSATGGIESVFEQNGLFYRVHSFADVGLSNFDVLRGGKIDVLIVGGGGSGGSYDNQFGGGGGGGAGGLIYKPELIIRSAGYLIIVGDGGDPAGTDQVGNNGIESGAFDLTSLGGGGGGSRAEAPKSGGSGGGASLGGTTGGDGVQPLQLGDSGEFGFGNNGGNSQIGGSTRASAGGGGAGFSGDDVTDDVNASNGGIGANFLNFFGESFGDLGVFAGGGGGAARLSGDIGVGGTGGGGNGGNENINPQSGMPNTGAGGGGANGAKLPSGAGGSGVVIIRYRITQAEFEAA